MWVFSMCLRVGILGLPKLGFCRVSEVLGNFGFSVSEKVSFGNFGYFGFPKQYFSEFSVISVFKGKDRVFPPYVHTRLVDTRFLPSFGNTRKFRCFGFRKSTLHNFRLFRFSEKVHFGNFGHFGFQKKKRVFTP